MAVRTLPGARWLFRAMAARAWRTTMPALIERHPQRLPSRHPTPIPQGDSMNRKRLWRGLAASLLVLTLAACGGGSSGTPAPTDGTDSGASDGSGGAGDGSGGSGSGSGGSGGGAQVHAGMGASTAAPTGQAYAWPQGVQVEQPVKGDDPYCVPEDQQSTPHTGHGGLVRLCLGLRNTGVVPVTVVLPPGLIFVSDSLQTQNGIVLQTTTIVVPPGSLTYYVPVYLYCLNLGRHPTAGGQDTYQPGPVTDDAAVLELLSLLQGKDVPLAFEFPLQEALWDITDGNGLTQDDRNAIAAL
jgi:hypothetical protein